MEFAANVTLRLKFTIMITNAVIVLKVTVKQVAKDVMECVFLFVQSMKIGSVIDAFVNQVTILSITSVLNVLKVNSMMCTK